MIADEFEKTKGSKMSPVAHESRAPGRGGPTVRTQALAEWGGGGAAANAVFLVDPTDVPKSGVAQAMGRGGVYLRTISAISARRRSTIA